MEKEKERNIHWPPIMWAPTRDQTHNPATCPEQESNQWPFVLWDNAHPTEPHWSRLGLLDQAEYREWEVLEETEDITFVWIPSAYLFPGHSAILVSNLFFGLNKISPLKTPVGGITKMS